ncbi:hypothetical protein APC21_01585 [Acinetobacter baumannii]|nr:hypothetical protein AM480_02480 [Acinetobacter baumannii]AXG83920.1 hypothetical protein Aba810CP_03840 [Acinetobacter baumannii]KQF72411.1 hypothetical protein APC21_01585 [Acinetobacter baumannii]KWA90465.1 hypothetical protein AWU48_13420 [Acinetobacter baumannii]OCT19387.1 hypothetical protein A8G88_06260 [Acinetobacter baumannii]
MLSEQICKQQLGVPLMKSLILAAILALPTTMTFAGPCDHSWQSAKDGSSCGDRAADRRPGGR